MKNKKIITISFFTLIELMIVIAIMAIVAVLYASSWKKDNSSQIKRCAMQMEDVAMGIKMYRLNYADDDPDPESDEVKAYLPKSLKKPVDPDDDRFSFEKDDCPVGGEWKLNAGCIRIVNPDLNEQEMTKLDILLDDGDLTTGDFRGDDNTYDFQIWGGK